MATGPPSFLADIGSFEVNVKDFQGHSIVISVNPRWNVGAVKQRISQTTNIDPKDFNLVFAGTPLKDDLTLMDIGVQGYSTLHCIRTHVTIVPIGTPLISSSLPPPDPDAGHSTDKAPLQHRFYVYCKKPCTAMAPGKLRVRCADCKDAAFILHRGPGGWDDVLSPRALHGRCSKEQCGGTDAEFYFRCANHPTEESDVCVALHMIRANTSSIECPTCFEIKDLMVVFNCPQHHSLCVECFVEYSRVALTSRQFLQCGSIGYSILCPAKCENSQVTESHHFRLLGKDLYDRYHRFGTEEFVLQMGGVLCPQANCGQGLLPEEGGRRVQCPRTSGCGFVFCRTCKRDYHSGSCQQAPPQASQEGHQFQVDPAALERARWVQENEKFIEENTKPCPRCHAPIEKNGGCMHMTCVRASCKHEWCWICGVEWNRRCQSTHWFG